MKWSARCVDCAVKYRWHWHILQMNDIIASLGNARELVTHIESTIKAESFNIITSLGMELLWADRERSALYLMAGPGTFNNLVNHVGIINYTLCTLFISHITRMNTYLSHRLIRSHFMFIKFLVFLLSFSFPFFHFHFHFLFNTNQQLQDDFLMAS